MRVVPAFLAIALLAGCGSAPSVRPPSSPATATAITRLASADGWYDYPDMAASDDGRWWTWATLGGDGVDPDYTTTVLDTRTGAPVPVEGLTRKEHVTGILDDGRLVVTDPSPEDGIVSVALLEPGTGRRTPLVSPAPGPVLDVQVSPAGTHAAWEVATAAHLVDLATGKAARIGHGDVRVLDLDDEAVVFLDGERLLLQRYDAAGPIEVLDHPRPLHNPIQDRSAHDAEPSGPSRQAAVSAGRYVTIQTGQSLVPEDREDTSVMDVYQVDASTGRMTRLSPGRDPGVSPSGRYVVLTTSRDDTPVTVRWDRETGETVELVGYPGPDYRVGTTAADDGSAAFMGAASLADVGSLSLFRWTPR